MKQYAMWSFEGRGVGKANGHQNQIDTTDSYTDDNVVDLLYMIEEEKLAGDVYEVLYEEWGLKIFDNIADSEDDHYAALINQAEVIGVDVDEIVLEGAGEFVNPELQDFYDDLIALGTESVDSALLVGIIIETKDLTDIKAAADEVAGTTLEDVYLNLLAGSENHLAAFEGQIA